MTEKIILKSDVVVKKIAIDGFVAENDPYKMQFISKNTAQWHGCTHVRCKCGAIVEKKKLILVCDDCRKAQIKARWSKMPAFHISEVADGVPVFSLTYDEWFNDCDEIDAFLEENEDTRAEDLFLVLGEPDRPRPFDFYDYVGDCLHEDSYCDEFDAAEVAAVEAAVNALANSVILSYKPGKVAVKYC